MYVPTLAGSMQTSDMLKAVHRLCSAAILQLHAYIVNFLACNLAVLN